MNAQDADIALDGYLDIEVDPTLDMFAEIARLKKKKCGDPCALLCGC